MCEAVEKYAKSYAERKRIDVLYGSVKKTDRNYEIKRRAGNDGYKSI